METMNVVQALRNSRKGNLPYNREKKLEDVYNELQQLICLSVQPPKHAGCEEKKAKIADARYTSIEEELIKMNNNKDENNELPDYIFTNFAEVEQEIIQYEMERKQYIKQLIADKKKNWMEYEKKFLKENKEKIEVFKKEEFDKNNKESTNVCIRVIEDISQKPSIILEKIDFGVEDNMQNESIVVDEQHEDESEQLSRRIHLEAVRNELSSNLAEINFRIRCYPKCEIEGNDSFIQFIKNASTDIQRIMNNQKILPSDMETALTHLSTSKQLLEVLNDNLVEKESSISNAINTELISASEDDNDFEQKVVEECSSASKNSSSNSVPSWSQETNASSCFKFSIDNCTHTLPVHTNIIQPSSQTLHIPVTETTVHSVLHNDNKDMMLHNNSSIPTTLSLPLPAVESLPDVDSQNMNKNKVDEIEEMELSVFNLHDAEIQNTSEKKMDKVVSSQDDSYNEHALSEYVSREALKKYLVLQKFLKKWKGCFEPVTSSPEWKKRRLDLQKAINTPINSMSVMSGAHLLDKIQRLSDLISGKNVEVAGKTMSINIAPEAKYFCMDLLAKKLVSQAENQVSSCHKDAFPLAAATVHLWQQFPDLGMLFMAHVYEKCPYLVPYYIPQQENQTEEEYFRALGYIYTGEVIEKKQQFLKRMSGIVRLYAAVIQTQPITKNSHPHGIQNAWLWLSRVMNLEPRSDITATVLLDFLQVCGHAMEKAYGKQFHRLLSTLAVELLPKIKVMSAHGSGGPLLRLQTFIEDTFKQGFISPPNGRISPNFWRTK